MVRILGAVLCAFFLLGTGACGSDDDDKASKSLSKSLQRDDGAGDLKLSREQADCVAGKMVDKVGVEDLQEYGILAEDLTTKDDIGEVKMSADDAEGAADSMTECVDAVALVVDSLGDAAGKEAGECLRDKLAEDEIHAFFEALFRGDQDRATQQLMQPMMSCVSDSQE